MHYAIAYKNSAGHTQRSEFTRFDSDSDALNHGRRGVRDNAIVEVWKGDQLLARLGDGEAKAASPPSA
jgi:hypothetical protein